MPFHLRLPTKDAASVEVLMKSIIIVLVVGAILTVATALAPSETLKACTPFVALTTGLLVLAYSLVAAEQPPRVKSDSYHRRAA
jgi:hypothetical protein